MKGKTARRILKLYEIAGAVLAMVVAGGGTIALIVAMFITSWRVGLFVVGVVSLVAGITALWIKADVNKHNSD